MAHYIGDGNYIAKDGACEPLAVVDANITISPLSATNAEALSFALEAGCGVALQPDFVVWEALRDGRP